jgi:hypothetical protein
MEDLSFLPEGTQFYHHHWVAFWKQFSFISLLLVLSAVGFCYRFLAGLVLLASALAWGYGIYLYRKWHIYAFAPDNRLIRCRGFYGHKIDVISLFGTITPYRNAILGPLLDVGSVDLSVAGPDVHIRHIDKFSSFLRRLVEGPPRSDNRSDTPPSVQVIIQLPGRRTGVRGWPDFFPPWLGPSLDQAENNYEQGQEDF